MNYLDLLIIIAFLVALKIGYSRGIIALIGGLAGKILSVLFALYFAKPLALWAGPNLGITRWLTAKLINFFTPAKVLSETDMGLVTAQKLPEVLETMGLPPLLKFKVMERAPELMAGGSASLTAIIQELANQTALLLLQALSFLVLLLLGGLLIRLLISLVNHTLAGTVIGTVNRLLGMTLGLSLMLVVVILVIGFTAPLILAPAGGEPGSLAEVVKGSYLYPRCLEAYGLLLGAIISR
jgi:uncharacterized membrane protein required for colicin V production